MRLYDDNNIQHVAKHSGSYMYKSQFKKRTEDKIKSKKFAALNTESSLFDDDPIDFNDLDLNMLNRSLIKFVPTDALRIELLLERAEKRLEKVYEEITASKVLDINESMQKDFLEKKKNQLLKEIQAYKAEYRELGLIYKLADILASLRSELILFINFIRNLVFSFPFISALVEKLPGYKEKQELKKLSLLQRKLKREINRKARVDHEKLEHLFIKTEELT